MDSFTERILERARERQRKLLGTGADTSLKSKSSPNITDIDTSEEICNRRVIASDSDLNTVTRFEDVKETHSTDMPGSPQLESKILNIQRDSFNMQIKVNSADNIRLQVEIEERSDNEEEDDKENVNNEAVCIRDDAKKRLQNLGKLYAGGEDANISSPIHRTEANFQLEEDEKPKLKNAETKESNGRKGLGGLAALATDINNWEDDLSTSRKDAKKTPPKRSWKPPAPRPPIHEEEKPKHKKAQAPQPPVIKPDSPKPQTETPNELEWDQKVLKNLESQGFTRTTSNARLIYNYNSQETNCADISESPKTSPSKLTPRSPIKSLALASKAAIFESSPTRTKDPALLSVSERKALFEKNKGAAPIPKPPISLATPLKVAKPQASDQVDKTPKTNVKQKIESVSPKKEIAENVTKKAMGIASTVAALFQNKSTIGQQQIENSTKQQRQKEMELLLNRFQRNKEVKDDAHSEEENEEEEETSETTAMIPQKPAQIIKRPDVTPPPPPPGPSGQKRRSGGRRFSEEDSPQVAAVLEDVKRIKFIPPKDGKLYPCLSDIETATETETEFQSPQNSSYEEDTDTEVNTSFGRDVLETVCKNITPQKRPVLDESTESDLTDVLDDMDDYLDEAMAMATGPTPPKQGRAKSPNGVESSRSFHYQNCSPKKQTSPGNFRTPVRNPSPRKEDSPTYIVEGDNVVPLIHTVSFYRRQQGQTPKTPSKQIVRQPVIEETSECNNSMQNEGVKTKMQQLLDEIVKQQTVISQTSQAINLCYSTPEFAGSTELVEAEQFLLLATSRRSAAQQQLENLQVTKSLVSQRDLTDVVDKGTLTISNICFPLKREYARALAAAGGKGHHVICLIKYKEKVLCTPLVSTVAGTIKNPINELKVPGTIKLEDVFSSFAIHVEVYCLQAQEEILPHDVKYHINKKSNSKATPKKSKENPLIKPPRESPAGPHAVRSPAFALMGYVIFNVQAINRKQFTLNNTPSMSPLTGIMEMNVKYDMEISVEHKGFLTMFEDVSGFGAWHRRWCYLSGSALSYWKYPDDEKKKAPIDTIDLRTCIYNKVGPVSKDICARLHTMLIETERSSLPDDKDSLITICRGEKTIIRHLLSADTKDERNEWCLKLNKALNAIKMSNKTANN